MATEISSRYIPPDDVLEAEEDRRFIREVAR